MITSEAKHNMPNHDKFNTGFSWRNPIHLLAFGLGAGKAPVIPGTFGSLPAIPLYFLLENLTIWPYLGVVFVMFFLGVYVCHITSRDMGVHDHSGIVFDEIVGMLITYIALPAGWIWLVTGFVLFRIFDIWKPFPIRQVDKNMGGGMGIMFDDVLAGIYALLTLQAIYYGMDYFNMINV